jgi:hypothetical protein
MGLDMYLYKKRYVKNWEHTPKEQRYNITIKKAGKLIEDKAPITYIVYDAGTWRKANAIHQWFVENVQDGEDNCGTYYVGRENLEALLDIVKKVLAASELVKGKVKNGQSLKDGKWVDNLQDGKYIKDSTVAKELLPTTEGFFFGGTEYDQWYYEDLKYTQKILTEALKDTECDFEYTSSW